MSSSVSSRSTLSGISDNYSNEVDKTVYKNRRMELSEGECLKCSAMKLNIIVAEKALASLSLQFKNVQKELEKTEQVTRINEEQAKYIDERRSMFEKLEADRSALFVEYENLQINYRNLKKQYDEVVATAQRNQNLIEEANNYRDTCKTAVDNLVAEQKARQELLSKYLKSVDAATACILKLSDSLKQEEKKCLQLRTINEKLEPFKSITPGMQRLLIDFAEIIERNGLMTKPLQKRFAKYRSNLHGNTLLNMDRVKNNSESSLKTAEDSSDDDELAKDLEDMLAVDSVPSIKSAGKLDSSSRKIERDEIRESKNISDVAKKMNKSKIPETSENVLRKKSEDRKTLLLPTSAKESKTLLYFGNTKTLRGEQTEPSKKRTKKKLQNTSGKEKDNDVKGCNIPSTSSMDARFPFFERDESGEKEVVCKCEKNLSTWLNFIQLDPLLPQEINRPTAMDIKLSESIEQQDDYMDRLFGGPLSPSTSSRRTSLSSTGSIVIPKKRARADSETSSISSSEFGVITDSSPLVIESPVKDLKQVNCVPLSESFTNADSGPVTKSSSGETITVIIDEDEITEKMDVEDTCTSVNVLLQEADESCIQSSSEGQISLLDVTSPLHHNINQSIQISEVVNHNEELRLGCKERVKEVPDCADSKLSLSVNSQSKCSTSNSLRAAGKSLGAMHSLITYQKSDIVKICDVSCEAKSPNSIVLPSENLETVLEEKLSEGDSQLEKLPRPQKKPVSSSGVFNEKTSELEGFQEGDSGNCTGDSILKKRLHCESEKRHVRIKSCSSEDSLGLVIDGEVSESVNVDNVPSDCCLKRKLVDIDGSTDVLNNCSAGIAEETNEILQSEFSYNKAREDDNKKACEDEHLNLSGFQKSGERRKSNDILLKSMNCLGYEVGSALQIKTLSDDKNEQELVTVTNRQKDERNSESGSRNVVDSDIPSRDLQNNGTGICRATKQISLRSNTRRQKLDNATKNMQGIKTVEKLSKLSAVEVCKGKKSTVGVYLSLNAVKVAII
ncbi:unnamed protein product [Thelazia callipaeda]|uniref:Shootin-1 n=1 Tax=Thelazia callipaeda TaxID=103827 RepID=A0A0N5CLM7_THECL|nr:unnamed protein product [Thelazia callipaeda]